MKVGETLKAITIRPDHRWAREVPFGMNGGGWTAGQIFKQGCKGYARGTPSAPVAVKFNTHNRKGICVHKSSNYIPNYPSAYAITQSVAQKSRFLQVFPSHLSFKIQLPFMSWNLGTYQSSNWDFVVLWWRSSAVFSQITFTYRRLCNLIRHLLHIVTSRMV